MQSLEREIAVLRVEADMAESHAQKLIDTASLLTDRDEQHNLLLLADEEGQQAATIREAIQRLKGNLR